MDDSADIRTVLTETYAKLMALYESGDFKSYSEHFTEDCRLLMHSKEKQTGRKAVEDTLQTLKTAGAAKLSVTIEEAVGFGDLAYSYGIFSVFNEDRSLIRTGKFLLIWKKINGVYYIHVDCNNLNGDGAKL
ncbi:uncharacterized protein [Ptychodera flava]|uniref:uncharacterized protein n=1 Tax=Ptychodera flava TaxID=63121 RepID=UPI00396A9B3A